MLLLIDNFDSFTYNIVHAVQEQDIEVLVKRNNKLTVRECLEINPDFLLIGPGPGTPKNSGISPALIKEYMGKIPVFGICLGMQLIAEMFGGKVIQSTRGPMHGKTSKIYHVNSKAFSNLPQGFTATRYHSLIVDRATLPSCLEVTAETEEGQIMGLAHKDYAIEGVQFHPESVISECGFLIFNNFLHTFTEIRNLKKGLITC